ncbi:MAG: DNA-3-methyladenine glycosylase 2 family protein [Betaproteobacteria bacterium]|nr:DNA-3-methyladenine glycosylase 2 family protein [Betaproteobacteria bacterium]
MHAPAHWKDAQEALSACCPVMRRLIDASGQAVLQPRGDPYQTLARSIVGQQISVKAAASVWARFEARCKGKVEPLKVSRMRISSLRECGLDPQHWIEHDDEAVIANLIQVRGIGRWTAEMFLIFNLLRPDVWPLDDIGLLRAIGIHWSDDPEHAWKHRSVKASRAEAAQLGERLRPWRSVATWYLWRSLDPLPVSY